MQQSASPQLPLAVSLYGFSVRIVNLLPPEPGGQGQDSNPDPEFLQAAIHKDQLARHLRFPGIKPPQAETKHDALDGNTSQTLEIEAQTKRSNYLPDGGK
ncbi:hypothetical protein DSO57_1035634 [Entomophthora muscae]|uniref:Uncharacterized protein n=1 Tax=Entomophthora muscae TaxID=34485 RepID=A0ACC2RE95_9FUNG|nr:hypothetical protein DSO57_1035634 [Entomophthora muscae]